MLAGRIGQASEAEYLGSVLLSRSRFIAPAQYSLRFYREYFTPESERQIEKDRLRWLVRYKDTEFFINLDRLMRPAQAGYFVEIKSRTWSKLDADKKAILIVELMRLLGAQPEGVRQEYVDLVGD